MNWICGRELRVLLEMLLMFGVVIGSIAIRWTGNWQLRCTIPLDIIESFFTIILITGHNSADTKRQGNLAGVFEERKRLLALVDTVEETVLCKGVKCPASVKLEEGD